MPGVREKPGPGAVLAEVVENPLPKARVREAFAQLPLSEQIPPVDARKLAAKPPKRKLAKTRPVQQPMPPAWQQPTMLVAQQPHFGLFGNTW